MNTKNKEKFLFAMEAKITKAYTKQEKTLLNLIETGKRGIERLNKNRMKMSSFNKVKALTRKILTEKHKAIVRISPTELLMEGLKKIGRPARVQEIVDKLTTMHITKFEGLVKNKKKLKQVLSNAVSLLYKTGEIRRKPFDNKTFEYSLPELTKGQHLKVA